MGGKSSIHQYGVLIGEEKLGETKILRHKEFADKPLSSEPSPGINTIWKAFEATVKTNPKCNFLGSRKKINNKDFSDYYWRTYSEVFTLTKYFGSGVMNLGLCPEIETKENGKFRFLGIYSKNREEWVISDLACHLNSITVVTIYDSLGDHTIEFIIDETQMTTMALETKNLSKLITLKKNNKAGSLKNVILYDLEDEKAVKEAVDCGLIVYLYPDIIKIGTEKEWIFYPCKPETIATFCYTSGTTGTPKGAMISHRGLLADISALNYTDANLFETDVHLSYLPLAHVMERLILTVSILKAIAVGFSTGLPQNIISDAEKLKPTIFVGVPKVFHRVYDGIKEKIINSGFIKKTLINRAISVKLANYLYNGSLHHALWDRLVCNRFKDALGGRVRLMLTGSAPISTESLNFIKVLFSCPILEGYGQTECCAAATLTAIADNIGGSVGGPISGAEIKLIDVKELSYLTTDKDADGNPMPRGEVLIKGPILFSGYFNNKDKTNEALDKEGWLHTGDVGMILPNNSIRIIDRVKNIFKLSIGEYIAPEKLENVYCKGQYVSQIYVHGESLESYLIAIVVPKKEYIHNYLTSINVESKLESLSENYNNLNLIKEIISNLDSLGRTNGFKGFEMIKKIHLTDEPFSIDNDLLTPTMKLKRHEAKKKYLEVINKLYKD